MNIFKIVVTLSAVLLPTFASAQTFIQNESVNVAAVVQSGSSSIPVTIAQTGMMNFSGVIQAGKTSTVTTGQIGISNASGVFQNGVTNTANVGQLGLMNNSMITQRRRITTLSMW